MKMANPILMRLMELKVKKAETTSVAPPSFHNPAHFPSSVMVIPHGAAADELFFLVTGKGRESIFSWIPIVISIPSSLRLATLQISFDADVDTFFSGCSGGKRKRPCLPIILLKNKCFRICLAFHLP